MVADANAMLARSGQQKSLYRRFAAAWSGSDRSDCGWKLRKHMRRAAPGIIRYDASSAVTVRAAGRCRARRPRRRRARPAAVRRAAIRPPSALPPRRT
eukprot:170979-Pleurochrysis_carterae.AAC.1